MSNPRHKRQFCFGEHSTINQAYSHVNQQWFVWREDAGYQALLARFDDEHEASLDFDNRVAFVRLINQAQAN